MTCRRGTRVRLAILYAAASFMLAFSLVAIAADLPHRIRALVFALVATFAYAAMLLPSSDKRTGYLAHVSVVVALLLSGTSWRAPRSPSRSCAASPRIV